MGQSLATIPNFKGSVITGDIVVLSFCVEPDRTGKQSTPKMVLGSIAFETTPENVLEDMRAVFNGADTDKMEAEFCAPDEEGVTFEEIWGCKPYFFFDIEYASPSINHLARDAYDEILG